MIPFSWEWNQTGTFYYDDFDDAMMNGFDSVTLQNTYPNNENVNLKANNWGNSKYKFSPAVICN